MKTKNLHYVTGIIITVFVGLHLFNHLSSIYGVEKHIEIMEFLRIFYRNIVSETILLIAVIVQIISGLKLFKSSRQTAVTSFEELHIWSGLYLAIFLIIHVGAVLSGRFILELDTNFYFGAAGLNTFPHMLFFIPYYGFAIISFFGHIASVHSKKMKTNVLGLSPKGQSKSILIFGIFLTVIIFYGLTDKFSGVEIPSKYEIMIGK
ncbi:hypothetical protein UMM65_12790 [Aureibaculum sp. 2210JD6-5]|uniref:hypothetical protein n=1 Tax=Aureibaculum sp. 2210JD6-5 TaxID=3103957 RepID=UPI002AAE9321|nr:hypothetical protein [Aureibaculum sp. 2210JD6-5]MDY7396120.1 hypothetical protein [Aureibaculum sp. 2210JD6-5]